MRLLQSAVTATAILWQLQILAPAANPHISLEQSSVLLEQVAASGNAATVGIYCETTPYLRYYGTGVVISPDGYILTSTTVVPPGAEKIWIHFTNHRRLPAELIEVNEDIESALLKVDTHDLPFIPLADKLPIVGETAYTFGNAHNMIRLGKNASFSVGIISGIYPVQSIDSQSSYAGLAIETDAAINPGQDGGPLLNSRGQLVGIISLSYSPRRWQGVAVPIGRIQEGLTAFQNGIIQFSQDPLIEALNDQGPTGRGVAGHARGVRRALAAIDVERTYTPENMPRLTVHDYFEKVKNFDQLSDDAKAQIVNLFYRADNLLATNQHVRRPAGLVTGVIVSPDGYILTSLFNIDTDRIWVHRQDGLREPTFNIHIENMTSFNEEEFRTAGNRVKAIHVLLPGNRRLAASVVARHVPLGIALLKVDADDLPWLDFSRLAIEPLVGTACGVIGLADDSAQFSLNTGMVSADKRNRDQLFQFDALLNYGNSGGPVIDRQGRLLGLALSPISPGPSMGRVFDSTEILQWQVAPNSGVSFAARADLIRDALPVLKAGISIEQLSGAFIGFAPATQSLLSDQVELSFIVPNSPADEAGLKKGDIIQRFNGRAVKSWKDVVTEVDQLSQGDEIRVQVMRPGHIQYLELNGKRVRDGADLNRLFQELTDGTNLSGKYIDKRDQVLQLSIKVGERQ